jgi:uncharacterized protein (TIGR00299 family) protein
VKKVLYFDCFSGISGDMTLGALIDLGVDKDKFMAEMSKLNVDGYEIKIGTAIKNGINATDVDVLLTNGEFDDHDHEHEHHHEHDHNHEHHHEHSHDHDHHHEHHHAHVHRNFYDVSKIIDNSSINENAKELAKKIFMRVAKAEGKVHGKPIEEVHFHEVGALDSIVDIIGTAVLIDMIKPDMIVSSVISDGHGFIMCQHGKIPVPVPATMEIFADANVKVRTMDIENEMVTPTGAAIIAELSENFGQCPEMKILKTGYGAGKRSFEIPNVLRVVMGEIDE